jgi:hypothetical protein
MQYWGTSQCAQVDRSSRTKEKPAEGQAPKPEDDVLQLAENLVAMRFYTLIRYVLTEMRNLLVLVITIYTVSIFALKCYPFRAHSAINWTLITVFILIGGFTMKAFAEMDRDAILSRIAGSTPGKISPEFYVKVLTYGAVPLLSILTAQFPSVSSLLFSWVQPTLEALK